MALQLGNGVTLSGQIEQPLMTRHIILGALMLLSIGRTYGQSDEAQIRATIQQFIVGTEYNYPDSVASSFYPDTRMFLYTPADTVWTVSPDTYASWYGRREPGTRNARYSSLVSLDIVNTVAYAKVQVDIPSFGNRYS
ncbi:MAG TPA: hypothetical protein DCP28_01250, partial [Cytophagales bacterium]|nr:hypothetical protein [Cytophagales bacterium]